MSTLITGNLVCLTSCAPWKTHKSSSNNPAHILEGRTFSKSFGKAAHFSGIAQTLHVAQPRRNVVASISQSNTNGSGEDENDWPMPVLEDSELVLDKFLAVIVLAITEDEQLVLTREYRHPVGKYILSAPGGVIDDGETPLEAAARELREETGHVAHNLRVIGSTYPLPGIWSQEVVYVAGDGAKCLGKPQLGSAELLQVELVPRNQVVSTVLGCGSADGGLVTGLYFLEQATPALS